MTDVNRITVGLFDAYEALYAIASVTDESWQREDIISYAQSAVQKLLRDYGDLMRGIQSQKQNLDQESCQ